MKVSVVIPVHNTEKYVEQALNSVFKQTLQSHQIILIDDASTDRSIDIVNKFQSKIEIYSVNYANAAQTRNEALKYATGDWMAFLDSDDIWYPYHLERIKKLVDQTGSVGYLNHFDHISIDGDIEKRNNTWKEKEPVKSLSDLNFIQWYNKNSAFVGMSACAVQTKRFKKIGGFNPDFKRRHDIEMWLRLIKGHKWSLDTVSSSAYRKNVSGSISSNIAKSRYYKFIAFESNKELYSNYLEFYTSVISKTARNAISSAIIDGDTNDFKLVWNDTIEYLGLKERIIFQIGFKLPSLYKVLIRVKRSIFNK